MDTESEQTLTTNIVDDLQVNNLDSPEPIITPHQAVRLCDRYLGVGADGVIFVMRHKKDYQMRIYNSDGSEPEVR